MDYIFYKYIKVTNEFVVVRTHNLGTFDKWLKRFETHLNGCGAHMMGSWLFQNVKYYWLEETTAQDCGYSLVVEP